MNSLNDIVSGFTNNQKKLHKKITPLVGNDVSIALVNLKGTEQTSFAELEVIANLISQFRPLQIVDLSQLILSGKGSKGHTVKIIPQYKVKNSINNSHPWAIDIVIELHRKIGFEIVKIASIGVEYDGYPTHFLENNIKKTYLRDTAIASDEGILSIRISQDAWKKDPNQFKIAIKKYFEHQIKIAEQVQSSTVNVTRLDQSITETLTTCPICNGCCKLAGDDCEFCHGMGSVKQSLADSVDLAEYDQITCPKCRNISLDCDLCNGNGFISRDKALSF
ncbi:hypothetical protein [Pseudoalteromonas sp. ZZD1]|uniref:hypothetical protein n=1 Tax=Pseudoalteromonas sp. ZZD1 TaxID=3139395 RepID=UPI003BAA88D6